MNKNILKLVIITSALVIIGAVMSFVLTSCTAAPCPDGTEDVGVGQCVPKDNK